MAIPVDLRMAYDIKVPHTPQTNLSLQVRRGGKKGGKEKEREERDRDRARQREKRGETQAQLYFVYSEGKWQTL